MQILTVGAVSKYIKAKIESDIHLLKFKVEGEISNLKYHSNGNMYFNIKDKDAQINCIVFKNFTQKLVTEFIDGDNVIVTGSIYFYIKSGTYNINVSFIEKKGIGQLALQYNELKLKLENEGLFKQEFKKPICTFPKKIAVITSNTGAAIKDILTTLESRYPIVEVTVFPTIVQGSKGVESIVNNIQLANKNMEFDTILCGRGGGSIEDLYNFNEEKVCRAIFNSKTPVISCVGHETDFTLADFVSSYRAATPTSAAQIATPDIKQLKNNIDKNSHTILNLINSKINVSSLKLENLSSNQYLVNPLIGKIQLMDYINKSMEKQIYYHSKKLEKIGFELDNIEQSYIDYLNGNLKFKRDNINYIHSKLDILNPLSIFSRGFTVTKKNNTIVSSISEVNINDHLKTQFKDGYLVTKVERKEYDE